MSTRDNSLAARLMRYFAANPDEELTIDDAMKKFGACAGTMRNTVGRLVDGNALEAVRIIRLPARGRAK